MNRRVFAAIDISDGARNAIEVYARELQTKFARLPVRWERPEKLHITVKFAGALNEEQLAIFSENVRAAANSIPPFPMKISGTGAFVKRRGPSVLWLGIEQLSANDPLGKVAAMLDGEERRPFHPHITIARIKDAGKVKELIEKHRGTKFESAEFEVKEIVIYESKLLRTGSAYSEIASFPFDASYP